MRRSTLIAVLSVTVLVLAAGGWFLWKNLGNRHLEPSMSGANSASPGDPLPPPTVPPVTPVDYLRQVSSSTPISADGIAAAWEPVRTAASQGNWQAWGIVADADTGEVLFEADGNKPHTPASTLKILTAFTALHELNYQDTLSTGVSLDSEDLYLWGEGDLLLSAAANNSVEINGRAGLVSLADRAVRVLKDRGITQVNLHYQNTLFDGNPRLETWAGQQVDEYVGAVGPFAIDAGRIDGNIVNFKTDSSVDVAQVLAALMSERGISTTVVGPGKTPTSAQEIARIRSAPVGEQIAFMLHKSDNTLAEQYCHLASAASVARGQSAGESPQSGPVANDSSYASSAKHVIETLTNAGINVSGLTMEECSGLSGNNQVTPRTLVETIRASVDTPDGSGALVRLFPQAGISGTITNRLGAESTYGNVQAKSGALGKVSSLTGVVTTASGRTLVFAIGTDNVPDEAAWWTAPDLDAFIESLSLM